MSLKGGFLTPGVIVYISCQTEDYETHGGDQTQPDPLQDGSRGVSDSQEAVYNIAGVYIIMVKTYSACVMKLGNLYNIQTPRNRALAPCTPTVFASWTSPIQII